MTLDVLTALTGAAWESDVVDSLERSPGNLRIARRCVDLADLLATAGTGQARAALVSADLRRLDRDAVARLASAQVAVVGLVTPGDEESERRLRQLGVRHLLPADASVDLLAGAVGAAVTDLVEAETWRAEQRVHRPPATLHDAGSGSGPAVAWGDEPRPRPSQAPGANLDRASVDRANVDRANVDGVNLDGMHLGAGDVVDRAGDGPEHRRDDDVHDLDVRDLSLADPGAALSAARTRPLDAEPPVPDLEPGSGRLVAVWGPAGAPGRTTLAVNLAAEAAVLGVSALLADADTYGGLVAPMLGLLDEAPGLAAATRLANTGGLDLVGLARLAPVVVPRLRVLTGIARADRWPELRGPALSEVWRLARSLAELTVVDCGFCLEQDEELAYDTTAPRRNAATLVTLAEADVVLAVCRGDALGVQRFVRALPQLRDLLESARLRVVVSRVRAAAVGPDPQRQLRDALDRYAGVGDVTFLPEDRAACDAALLLGASLAEAAPGSELRRAVGALAAELVDRRPAPRRRRRLLARSPR